MVFMNRRIYFIKKDFQFRFILRFVATTTIWAAATVSLFVFMAERKLEDVFYSSHINIKSSVELLMPSALQAHVISLLLFTAVLSYAIYSLWTKLSVPLYSLKKDIARIAGGDLINTVTLREDEKFHDLASDLDGMRRELRKRFIRVKENYNDLFSAASALDRAALKGALSAQHAAALREATAKMKEVLNGFSY